MKIVDIIVEATSENSTETPDTTTQTDSKPDNQESKSNNAKLKQEEGNYTVNPSVKELQTKLQTIGYDLGPTGVDGKYGPYTAAAVAAFKSDYKINGPGSYTDGKTLWKLNGVTSGKVPKVKPSRSSPSSPSNGKLPPSAQLEKAKSIVEQFHGSKISDSDWDMLVRATFAEASPHPGERAGVMAVILNRVRSSRYPNTIPAVLTQTNQFQSVTGTPANRTPSRHYTRTPSDSAMAKLADAITQYMPSANRSWLNFTSAVSAAYGAGTNIGFMHKVAKSPGAKKIGKTWFGTV